MDKVDPLPCIICGAKLENVFEEAQNQVYGGTCFKSYGHYGSTVFDPMSDRRYLEINICDPCLLKRQKENAIYFVRERPTRSIHEFKYWEMEDDE